MLKKARCSLGRFMDDRHQTLEDAIEDFQLSVALLLHLVYTKCHQFQHDRHMGAVDNLSIALFVFDLKFVTNIYGLLQVVKHSQVFHFSKVDFNFVIITGFYELMVIKLVSTTWCNTFAKTLTLSENLILAIEDFKLNAATKNVPLN
uniref:Uncharacterized protein n=1 Tax=Glossina pallidipes TaxID=7398 RepID=A0A1A9Z4L8_GLOPL